MAVEEITLLWSDGYVRSFKVVDGLRGIRHGQARPLGARWTTVEPKWDRDLSKEEFIEVLYPIFAKGTNVEEVIRELFGAVNA